MRSAPFDARQRHDAPSIVKNIIAVVAEHVIVDDSDERCLKWRGHLEVQDDTRKIQVASAIVNPDNIADA